MNILIAINSKYVIPAKVMLTSLFENNNVNINVYLLHSNLKEFEIEVLRELIEDKYKNKLHSIYIDKNKFENLPISHHFTIETYYRFLAQSILPNNLDRILWLDADMIIKSSINELYFSDFEDKYIVVCQSINKNPEVILEKLNLPKDSKYFNAGTILFNLDKIRKDINPMIYFDYIENNREKITWLDQDVLNVIYNKKAKYEEYYKYNMQLFSEEKLSKESLKNIKYNTAIIHYIGACKPWDFKYKNYCKKYYWKYAKKSEGYVEYIKFSIMSCIYKIFSFLKNSYNKIILK